MYSLMAFVIVILCLHSEGWMRHHFFLVVYLSAYLSISYVKNDLIEIDGNVKNQDKILIEQIGSKVKSFTKF